MTNKKLKYILFRDLADEFYLGDEFCSYGRWFFRIQSRNGNVLAKSGKAGYARRIDALKTLNLLKPLDAEIEERIYN